MLTESEGFIKDEDGGIKAQDKAVYLYGKEINGETYAICKSDMMIKGNDPERIKYGSTLATDEFGGMKFDFMRRYIIENDWLETIIQLPNNIFYNTGISTYIWVLSNNKIPERRGKVQLIDSSELYRKLRKNLGDKNCEFSPQHIETITQAYLDFTEGEIEVADNGSTPAKLRAKIFDNADFGYYKVTIERPLRLAVQITPERIATLRFIPALQEIMEWAYQKWGDEIYSNLSEYKKLINEYIEKEEIDITAKNKKALLESKTWKKQKDLLTAGEQLSEIICNTLYLDFNEFSKILDDAIKQIGLKLSSSEKNQILNAISWREEKAEKVIKKVHKLKGEKLEQLLEHLKTTEEHLPNFCYWESGKKGEWIEYDSDSEIRDTENIPLKELINEYFLREVRPHVEDAWINWDKTNIGYEISFNKYFYQHKPLRSLEEVTAEILELEQETDGLLKKLIIFEEWC